MLQNLVLVKISERNKDVVADEVGQFSLNAGARSWHYMTNPLWAPCPISLRAVFKPNVSLYNIIDLPIPKLKSLQ